MWVTARPLGFTASIVVLAFASSCCCNKTGVMQRGAIFVRPDILDPEKKYEAGLHPEPSEAVVAFERKMHQEIQSRLTTGGTVPWPEAPGEVPGLSREMMMDLALASSLGETILPKSKEGEKDFPERFLRLQNLADIINAAIYAASGQQLSIDMSRPFHVSYIIINGVQHCVYEASVNRTLGANLPAMENWEVKGAGELEGVVAGFKVCLIVASEYD